MANKIFWGMDIHTSWYVIFYLLLFYTAAELIEKALFMLKMAKEVDSFIISIEVALRRKGCNIEMS